MTDTIRRFVNDAPELAPFQAKAPWAEAVELPANARLLFLSGQGPEMIPGAPDPEAIESHGDMERQTFSVLSVIRAALAAKGYAMADIVKMIAYLRCAPGQGTLDLEGFGRAYRRFFGDGGDLCQLPARSRVEVARLMNPGWLVEIEVIAARVP
ncbi:Rid family hydrolase [Poseidonocella sp. HB161398]|uniref:Rid family hydrolase n=1 Tax=Poseidonocella sp. HB161398 TaxID=2320855 RepID=UPI0014871779|nr:Rid family hydrolase [Poseidonocella sp. HB161398]